MIVSETHQPPARSWVDHYERGLDPWHADAFPAEFRDIGTKGERLNGWFLIDWCGNPIGFCPDGTEFKE